MQSSQDRTQSLLSGGADLNLLSSSGVLLVAAGDGTVLLVVHLIDQLGYTEEVVHLLESKTLGFGNKEPDEDEHGQAEAGEGDEGSVAALAHGDQHVGHGAGNDEVEEPLGGGGKGDVEATETGSRDLGDVDPADLIMLC